MPVTTKTTKELFNGNASQKIFPFTIEYEATKTSDLKVEVGGVVQTETTHYTISGVNLTFVTAPPAGTNNVVIYRQTSLDTRLSHSVGSSIRSIDLNRNQDQFLFAAQELKNNQLKNQDSASTTPPANPNPGTRWFDANSGITYIYYTDTNGSHWVEANPNYNFSGIPVNAEAVPFTNSNTGGVVRTTKNKLEELISVKDFGAKGDGTTDDTDEIKAAIEAGSGVNIVYFPAGTYIVSKPIIIPSNTYIKGAGAACTSIKMKSNVGRLTGLGVIGKWDTPADKDFGTENVLVEDITFDFNKDRWHGYIPSSSSPQENDNYEGVFSETKSGTYNRAGFDVTITGCISHGFGVGERVYVDADGTGTDEEQRVTEVVSSDSFKYKSGTSATTTNASCSVKAVVGCAHRNALTIFNSKYVTLNRVRCLNGQRHCLDITSPYRRKDSSDETTTAYYLTATTYMHKGARYITVNDCYFTGAGDDNLTTHFSSDILITNCLSESPRGGYSSVSGKYSGPNTNCFEIDDGSRNVQMYNCRAYKGNNGLEIKAHGYAPAPYNILVDGLEIINCVGGVEAHHSNWKTRSTTGAWAAHGGNTDAAVPSDLVAGYTSGQLSSLSEDGYSATANNLTLNNIQIIAPRKQQFHKKLSLATDTHQDKRDGLAPYSYPLRCFEIGAYNGVQVNNLLISDGTKDRRIGVTTSTSSFDYEPVTNLFTTDDNAASAPTGNDTNGFVIHIHNSVRNLSLNNVTINGFFSKADTGIRITSNNNETFSINNLTVIDGPALAIDTDGSDGRYLGTLDNYNIYQSNDPTTNTNYNSLNNKYAIKFTQNQIHVGQGTIKGYAAKQGVQPLEYTPLVYGYDNSNTSQSNTANLANWQLQNISDCKYNLKGNMCTVFLKLYNIYRLQGGSNNPTGDLRVSLPFRPLEGGFTSPAQVDLVNIGDNAKYVIAQVVDGDIYSDSSTKKGYVHFKEVKDNVSQSEINCADITEVIATADSSTKSDINATITYLIDETSDPNFP